MFARKGDYDDIDAIDKDPYRSELKAYDWEIADVCFGRGENDAMDLLTEMGGLQLEHARQI